MDGLPTTNRSPATALTRFTHRQAQIVALIADGGSNKDIAATLHVSSRTVASHLQRLYLEAGIHTRGAAVAAWLRAGS